MENPKVRSAEDMDAETFLKHFNARHTPLGGLNRVGKSNVPGDSNEDLLRTYHNRVHTSGFDASGRSTNHSHGKAHNHE